MDTSFKRILAYVIDILIVSLVMTPIISLKAINPYVDDYNKYYEQYTELVEKGNNNEVDVNSDEYKNQIIELNYKLGQYKQVNSSLSVASIIVYFVIIQYFLKGQTIGKKILKLRVVSNKDKELNIGHYFLRSIILNNIIFSLLLIFGVYIFNAEGYYVLSLIVSYLQLLVMSIILLMVVLRKDNRGLHDFVAGTKVISTNVLDEEISKEKIKTIEVKENSKKTTPKSKKEDTNKTVNKSNTRKTTKKMTSTKNGKKL